MAVNDDKWTQPEEGQEGGIVVRKVPPPPFIIGTIPGGRFKNTCELLNLRALTFLPVNKIYISQCMSKVFCVELQRWTLKFHTKYLRHTMKDMILYNIEIVRTLRLKSTYAFFKRSPDSTNPRIKSD